MAAPRYVRWLGAGVAAFLVLGFVLWVSYYPSLEAELIRASHENKVDEEQPGHRLVFVGDSVVTYQYLALALALHKRRFVGLDPAYGSVLAESLWSPNKSARGKTGAYFERWSNYYHGTNAMFEGQEICDCYRADCHPSCVPQSFAANRFYIVDHRASRRRKPAKKRSTDELAAFWEDAAANELVPFRKDTARVGVVFSGGTIIKARSRYTTHMTPKHFQRQQESFLRTGALEHGPAPVWDTTSSTDLSSLLRVAAEVQPSILIVGLENHWPRDKPIQGGSYCALAQMLVRELKRRKLSIKVVLRTNGVGEEVPRTAAPRCVVCEGVLVYDVWSISQAVRQLVYTDRYFFFDEFHYHPWVYDRLNLALLRLLGYGEASIEEKAEQSIEDTEGDACIRPECADCVALWRTDTFYDKFTFGCPLCSVTFMKPLTSENANSQASLADSKGEVCQRNATMLWTQAFEVRRDGAFTANKRLRAALAQAEQLLASAHTNAIRLSKEALAKAGVSDTLDDLKEQIAKFKMRNHEIQGQIDKLKNKSSSRGMESHQKTPESAKGRVKDAIARLRQLVRQKNDRIEELERSVEDFQDDEQLPSAAHWSDRQRMDENARYRTEIDGIETEVRVLSKTVVLIDKLLAGARTQANVLTDKGREVSLAVMKKAEINASEWTKQALKLERKSQDFKAKAAYLDSFS